ncbi:MAG: hypothetical protein HYV65_02125 [Candidatus Spechtbacteria bacterium]|nr:hypothetical protein [Candidatus Spechtbacteria bacterium]
MHILLSLLLKKYQPKLVVVFGRQAREEARAMTATVLRKKYVVAEAAAEDVENAIWHEFGEGFLRAIGALIITRKKVFPEVLVISCEPNGQHYQNLKNILGVYAVVITPIGDIPSFVDDFAGEGSVKIYLEELKTLPAWTFLVLNYDDETVRSFDDKTNIKRYTYGMSERADISAQETRYHLYGENNEERAEIIGGMHAKVRMEGSIVPFRIPGAFGRRHIYGALAAIGIASRFDMNIVEAIGAMNNYKAPMGTGALQHGIKGSVLLDASTHATPFFVRELMDISASLKNDRDDLRVVVALSDLVHFGKGEERIKVHEAMGEYVGKVASKVYLVGEQVRFAEQVISDLIGTDKVHRFENSQEAARDIQPAIRTGDLVIVMGSPESRMETIVEELTEVAPYFS